ncbi:uncharacterized protein LOC125675273 [Ostrea edulis]|uniref:uncharacterized protein LOC125675273 n=1 Tax=Ostrea edulis TaxID=37623 RepID=UPI0020951465|nr:uncharacterized protein LOC125675273 [Ostrea edulis]
MMLWSCFVLGLFSTVFAAHTTRHPHHNVIEEGFAFHYDHTTHIVALKANHHCYLYVLSGAEQQSVHTSTGLHAIEKTMIDLVDTPATTVAFTAQDLNLLSHGLHHFCGHAPVLKIN